VSDLHPVAADRIRKVVAVLIAVVGTWLLLRVLYRLANGSQRWLDPELAIVLVLGAAATLWVRAARHVREPRDPPPP
jgi:hypothetical protein